MDLILVGFMGAGKTTVSGILADDLALAQRDLDDLITDAAGQTIPEIFASRGESGFRALETQTLRAALQQPGILATGGGTPVQDANFAVLQDTDVPVVLLDATPESILTRIGGDTNRPLVQQLGPRGLSELQAQRNPRYHALADLVIATDDLTPEEIAAQIKAWLINRAGEAERA
ncbi:shikimate kinase [Lacticaseibacillus pabuli]|uniref:Shikimate kinase n=1 Tax=Lacticaseibacillus pabuli TaxID=3025672 RepID=A0ABY7WS95_9LACO|nr:shikimate kinase [Lacticaseibacillus sp. KACC 23028]WDF82996.1 shikimate kinase [Lacticaseibacillus sp. KACC 23028]